MTVLFVIKTEVKALPILHPFGEDLIVGSSTEEKYSGFNAEPATKLSPVLRTPRLGDSKNLLSTTNLFLSFARDFPRGEPLGNCQ